MRLQPDQTKQFVRILSASNLNVAIPTACFFLAFAIFASIAPNSFLNGDMPIYAEQIRNGDFSQRSTHIGYYLLGYVLNYLPLPLDYALNVMSALFAAGTVVTVYLVATEVTQDRVAALAGTLVLLVNDALLIQAIHAEVYMPQTFFALTALLAWIKSRPLLAGALFAEAFLISASSAFLLVAFPLMRREPRSIALAGLSASIIVLAVLASHMDNYLFGARGLSAAAAKGVDLTMAALKTGRDVFFGFYATMPFLIAGTVKGLRDFRSFTLAVSIAWLVTFVFGEKFADVPVQLPVYCLATILVGVGIVHMSEAGRSCVVLCTIAAITVLGVVLFFPVPARITDHLPSKALLYGFVAACLLSFFARMHSLSFAVVAWLATAIIAYDRVIKTARETDEFARASVEAYAKAPENALFVGEWNAVMRFNWNARRKTYTNDIAFVHERARIEQAYRDGRAVWALRDQDHTTLGELVLIRPLPVFVSTDGRSE